VEAHIANIAGHLNDPRRQFGQFRLIDTTQTHLLLTQKIENGWDIPRRVTELHHEGDPSEDLPESEQVLPILFFVPEAIGTFPIFEDSDGLAKGGRSGLKIFASVGHIGMGLDAEG
jgi:hypothetical protein